MRATVILLAACLALAGCSSSTDGDSKPNSTPTPSATSTAPVETSAADLIAACTDALAAGAEQDGPECAGLSPDDLLTAIRGSNQRGRDALQSAIASAAGQ